MVTYHRHSQTVFSDQDLCFLSLYGAAGAIKNLIGLDLLTLFKSDEQDKLRNSPFSVSQLHVISSLIGLNLLRQRHHNSKRFLFELYELIYQLNAVGYLLCTFSWTCFGLTRPSSGAMDVTISLHIQHMVSLV